MGYGIKKPEARHPPIFIAASNENVMNVLCSYALIKDCILSETLKADVRH